MVSTILRLVRTTGRMHSAQTHRFLKEYMQPETATTYEHDGEQKHTDSTTPEQLQDKSQIFPELPSQSRNKVNTTLILHLWREKKMLPIQSNKGLYFCNLEI